MKKELEMKLVKKYPSIFVDYGGDIRKTCMGWGMMCGDGWYNILDNLCTDLMNIVEGTDVEIIAVQVKEKFGGLRFYFITENAVSGIYDKISKRVNLAESESYRTCESCGREGEARGGGWIRTLCDKCVDN